MYDNLLPPVSRASVVGRHRPWGSAPRHPQALCCRLLRRLIYVGIGFWSDKPIVNTQLVVSPANRAGNGECSARGRAANQSCL
jgi:hypothetical protein